jgi:chromosome segregation ATPase
MDPPTVRYVMDRWASIYYPEPFAFASSNLDLAERQVQWLSTQTSKLDADPTASEGERELMHVRLADAVQEREDARHDLAGVQQMQEALSGNQNLRHEADGLEAKDHDLEARLASADEAARQSQAKIAELTASAKGFDEANQRNAELQKTVDSVNPQVGQLNNELARATAENSGLRSRLAELAGVDQQSESTIVQLKAALADRDGLTRRNAELQARMDNLAPQVNQLGEALHNSETERDQLRYALSSTKATLAQVQTDRDQLRDKEDAPNANIAVPQGATNNIYASESTTWVEDGAESNDSCQPPIYIYRMPTYVYGAPPPTNYYQRPPTVYYVPAPLVYPRR